MIEFKRDSKNQILCTSHHPGAGLHVERCMIRHPALHGDSEHLLCDMTGQDSEPHTEI